jgi:hypothetical protein
MKLKIDNSKNRSFSKSILYILCLKEGKDAIGTYWFNEINIFSR